MICLVLFERIEFLLLLRMLNFTDKNQPSTSVHPSGVNCTKNGSMSNGITEQSVIYVTDGPYHDAVNKADSVFIDTLLPSLINVCILILIGIPGTILVICVYLLKLNKSTSRVFILALCRNRNVIPTGNVIHYIFGYYIFGCDRPTENVITENVTKSVTYDFSYHSGLAGLTGKVNDFFINSRC